MLRTRRLLCPSYFIDALVANHPARVRRIGSKLRTKRWWQMIQESASDNTWLEHFHMSKNTFYGIVGKLENCDTLVVLLNRKGSLDVSTKVAIAIYKLANACEYSVVGNLFGVHKSTVFVCLNQVCKAINDFLLPIHVRMPTLEEALDIADDFEGFCGLPQVIGAVDCTHIPINPPTKNCTDYKNEKDWSSMILQAVVDNKYMFRNISCNKPGTSHHALVLTDSELCRNVEDYLPSAPKYIEDGCIDFYLVGSKSHPTLPWLLTPYAEPCDEYKESFNLYLESAREVTDCGFGRLKGRFRCLSKSSDFLAKSIPLIVPTCVTLHNIVESVEDGFSVNWLESLQEDELKFSQPSCPSVQDIGIPENECPLRDIVMDFMSKNYELRHKME
ncbi:uncharacterized protein LOC129004613 isoform X2 [Macrosteles quadrilineatus]|nr:uncharacterized protein LOC129004613 isoform X2 [Macrosteles quadrilineatus]XP_054289143.1 uncharacterized protein LOC129004613 isoform X2 [Macrosteles quadrilineatus]